jgi:hypothetical protein
MSARPMLLLLLVACAPAAPPVAPEPDGHDHHEMLGADPGEVGLVHLPISCAPDAQHRFDRAVAMLHSFWFAAAESAFADVREADEDCAMAEWGIAMTMMGNPMARIAPNQTRLEAGRRAALRAEALARTTRERAYAATVTAFFVEPDLAYEDRAERHEQAFAALHGAHPDDDEATIFYARALIANAPPDDLSYARQVAGAELLEPMFRAHPRHPGLAHYIIHAYDAPALAERGREAAFAYADIAPAAPHALHMPSHIFTRLGYWTESAETNARSAAAEPNPDAAVHPMDYMVYAYLQQGRDRSAGEIVARAVLLPDRFYAGLLGYNFAAMPARFELERERWASAAELPVPTAADPPVEAITRFARAIGAARAGQPDAAAREVASLDALERAVRQSGDAYWTTVVRAQRLASEAWATFAAGDRARAIALAHEAADLEETVEKHPVTPGPLLPARELLGDMLLEAGRPADARIAYEATLQREPNRARTTFGAARAAERAGDLLAARAHYEAYLTLMERAEEERSGIALARAALAGR